MNMYRTYIARWLPPLGLAVVLITVYLQGMAPGLTWAHYGADGGDLIAAAATGGVAHPTGYPLYLILAQAFQQIPIGTLAYRTNLLSAFAATLAAVLVYHLVLEALGKRRYAYGAGLAAAFAFGLAPLLWSQALITEVYTLHAFFVALLLFLTRHSDERSRYGLLRAFGRGLAFGLAMGNHLTIALLFPLLAGSVISYENKKFRFRPELAWRSLAGLLLGLSVYAILPMRALTMPPVNWGNAASLAGFFWLVSGGLYREQPFDLSLIGGRLQMASEMALQQFSPVGLTLGLIGLMVFFSPSQLYWATLWTAAAFSIFALGYPTDDSAVYLIPAVLSIAVWIGVTLGRLADLADRRLRHSGWALFGVFLLLIFVLAGFRGPSLDASRDLRAENFGRLVMSQAPADAILFVTGDRAVFGLWYFHYALHQRPDLAVVAVDLLHFPWYQQTLRAVYPSLVLAAPFPFAETIAFDNPARPTCYIQYLDAAEITCLPRQNP